MTTVVAFGRLLGSKIQETESGEAVGGGNGLAGFVLLRRSVPWISCSPSEKRS